MNVEYGKLAYQPKTILDAKIRSGKVYYFDTMSSYPTFDELLKPPFPQSVQDLFNLPLDEQPNTIYGLMYARTDPKTDCIDCINTDCEDRGKGYDTNKCKETGD